MMADALSLAAEISAEHDAAERDDQDDDHQSGGATVRAPASTGPAPAPRTRRIQPTRAAHARRSSSSTYPVAAFGGGGGGARGSSRHGAPYELPRWARHFERFPPDHLGSTTRASTASRLGRHTRSTRGGDASDPNAAAAEDAGRVAVAADEDYYLRCRAYAMADATVDRALVRAWADSIGNTRCSSSSSNNNNNNNNESSEDVVGGALVHDLEAFFARYRPKLEDEETDVGTGETTSTSHPNKRRRLRLDDDNDDDDDADGTDSRPSVDNLASQAAQFLQPVARDPTILPLALLSVGPSMLDRVELVKLVHRGLCASRIKQSDQANGSMAKNHHGSGGNNNKAAVCVLRGGPYRSNTGKSFHGHLLRDIVAQCIAQEPHRSQYLHLLDTGRGKSRFKHISYTERLVEWASLTEEFHSIIVILEDPEALPHRTYDAFMATVTSLRACHGVPIGLVMASIDHVGGRAAALSRSSLDGIAGIDVRSFAVPPSDVVLDNLMSKFFVSSCESISLAVILGAPILSEIKASFMDNNRSVVEAAMRIKLALAHHFTQKGSFLSMAQISSFTAAEWQRLAWFCVDRYARSYIMCSSSRDSDMTSGSCASIIRRMIWQKRLFVLVNAWIKHARNMLPSLGGLDEDLMIDFGLVEGRASESSCFDDLFKALGECIREMPVKDIKAMLLRWRGEMKLHEASFAAADKAFRLVYEYVSEEGGDLIWRLYQEDLNSFIVLFDHQERAKGRALVDETSAPEVEKDSVCRELRASLIHSLDMKCRMLKGLNMPFSTDRVKEDSDAIVSSGFSALLPQVRRGIARALVCPPALPSRETSITHDPAIVFQALTTRVVDIEEWYQAFSEEVNRSTSPTTRGDILWQRFIFAVHQLEMCGLVCRSRRRGGNASEKTAMVWASGS